MDEKEIPFQNKNYRHLRVMGVSFSVTSSNTESYCQ